MIPHAPPMLFELEGDEVLLPANYPLCEDGVFPAISLLELAAQLAGRTLQSGASGMLVDIADCTLLRPEVPAGERLRARVRALPGHGQLHRFQVELEGVLHARVSLWLST